MTNEIQLFAKVCNNGALQGISHKKLQAELKRFFANQSIEILIHRKKKHRSVQQNRVQWMYYTMISEVTGYTKEEVHAICKSLFLQAEKVNEKTGSVFSYVKSTTELTTTEHMDYSEQIKQWASEEFGIVLPDPGEQMDLITHTQYSTGEVDL